MQLKQLSKKSILLGVLRNLLFVLILTVFAGIALATAYDTPAFSPVLAIVAAVWVSLTALLMVWPFLTYHFYRYGYDDKRVVIRYGVLFRHQVTAPICQIQDLVFTESPLMLLLGLGNIEFATAGSNFSIYGLAKPVALQIVDEVEALVRERVEGGACEKI